MQGGEILHVGDPRLFLGIWELPVPATRSPELQMRGTERPMPKEGGESHKVPWNRAPQQTPS